MDDRAIRDRIVHLLHERLGLAPEAVVPSARLVEDLGMDSVECVELALAVELEFRVTIPDHVLGEVRTLDDVVAAVRARRAPLSAVGG